MTERAIYEYEVVLRVTSARDAKLVTRIEHAYGVQDALWQALFVITSENEGAKLSVVSIGPPAEAIRRAEEQLAKEITAHVSDIGRALRSSLDVVATKGGKATIEVKK